MCQSVPNGGRVLPDIESPYYWVRNLINMVVWLLCLAGALFGILWIAQQIGGDILPLDRRYSGSVEAARSAAAAGNHRMAIEHFAEALAIDDTSPDLWLGRSISRLAAKDAQGALDDAATAVSRGIPENQVLLLRAQACQLLGKPGEAIDQLDRIIAADPGAREARKVRASIHASAGALDMAIADLDALLAANPSDPDAKLLRAEIALRKDDWASAAADFLMLVRALPEQPKLWVGAGVALLGAGRDSEAFTAFEEALAAHHSGPHVRTAALLGQAVSLRRMEQLERAINAWNVYTALARTPIAPDIQSVTIDSHFIHRVYFQIASATTTDDGFVPTSKEAAPATAP